MGTNTNKTRGLEGLKVLAEYGFTAARGTWRRTTRDSVVVLRLEKSWGRLYHLEFLVWLASLGEWPGGHQCHLNASPDRHDDRLRVALNLDCQMADTERAQQLRAALVEYVVPFALQCGTHAGIRAALNRGLFDLISLDARRVLDVPVV